MGSCQSRSKDSDCKRKQILIFLGSNSSSSVNKALMEEMVKSPVLSQKSYRIVIPKLQQIPFYNPDLAKPNKIPKTVIDLLKNAERASAIIFITPEYNGAVSPSILNAYQWVTQLPRAKQKSHNPIYSKPIAVMSCSYLSKRQINDIEVMTKTSDVKLFSQNFWVDLKMDQISKENHQISQKLKRRLGEWIEKFVSFVQKSKDH